MKHIFFTLLLGAVLLSMNGCDKAGDLSGPSADIQNIYTGESFITFEISTSKSDEVAYKVTAADVASMTAEQIFSEGTVVLPGYQGCENGLQANTEYTVYAASRTYDGTYSKVASCEVRTKEAGHFKVELSYINYAAVAFDEIVPDDPNKRYIMFVFVESLEDIAESFGLDSPDDIPQYMFENNYFNEYETFKGTVSTDDEYDILIYYDCPSDSDVYISLWYLNDDLSPASPLEYTKVRTSPVPDRSPLYFDIEKMDVQKEGVEFTIRSNLPYHDGKPMYLETWSGIYYYKASMFEEGMTDHEIAQTVLDFFHDTYDFTPGILCGLDDGCQFLLEYRNDYFSNCAPDYEPGEEYLVVFFGTAGGKITTDPVVRRFIMPDDGKDLV